MATWRTDYTIGLFGVGKQYRRGTTAEPYKTLREAVTSGLRALAAAPRRRRSRCNADALFWALRDVSIEVRRGSALGLIGPNGAGKSTLLKILSRVTEPTTGEIRLQGRVGSLLEVGTGFHPELTGRENVLLNGAILGMTRREILTKFDAIVDFAETSSFIDTPVKHYSSGMYLRLAFAVAAHLEPEILLVDEVLAVGDAAFQKRCLRKMDDVAKHGRTVIFVSHNVDAIRRLCSHTVLLEQGTVACHGDTSTVLARYLSTSSQRPAPGTCVDVSAAPRAGTGAARFVWVSYTSGCPRDAQPYSGGPVEYTFEIESDRARQVRSLAVFLLDQYGTKVLNADTLNIGRSVSLRRGRTTVRLRMPAVHLMPGVYRVGLWLADPVQAAVGAPYDFVESAFDIEVARTDATPMDGAGGLVTCAFDVEEVGDAVA
jgi:lipopolysaccharide transport system ATP-binding protein